MHIILINYLSSHNIITNKNNILLINPIPNLSKPYKIISFIGDAQIGKSTLINCFIFFYVKKYKSIQIL